MLAPDDAPIAPRNGDRARHCISILKMQELSPVRSNSPSDTAMICSGIFRARSTHTPPVRRMPEISLCS